MLSGYQREVAVSREYTGQIQYDHDYGTEDFSVTLSLAGRHELDHSAVLSAEEIDELLYHFAEDNIAVYDENFADPVSHRWRPKSGA